MSVQAKITAHILEVLTTLAQNHRKHPGEEVKAELEQMQHFLPERHRERFKEDFKDAAQFRTYGQFAATDEAISVNFLPMYANFVAAQLATPLEHYIPESIPIKLIITISPEGLGLIEFHWAYSMVLRTTNPNNHNNA
ncbi:hypothetical protein [Xanthomonas phage RTH11]|nr:hypothetical protein [Xanthomonas phage RTH11]